MLALVAADSEEKCNNGCTLITKYKIKVGDEDKDMLADMPDSVKKCQTTAAACTGDNVCKAFTPSVSADLEVSGVKGKMDLTAKTEFCVPKDAKMTTEICDQYTTAIKSMVTGGVFSNVKADCGKLSGASSFGFGALLVSILYILY